MTGLISDMAMIPYAASSDFADSWVASSGQISRQSFGRRSLRETSPFVNLSMIRHLLLDMAHVPLTICDICEVDTPNSFAIIPCSPRRFAKNSLSVIFKLLSANYDKRQFNEH